MELFHLISTSIVLSAIFTYINFRYLKLANTVGLTLLQANAQAKNCNRAYFATADQIVLKNSRLFKKNKNTPTYGTW